MRQHPLRLAAQQPGSPPYLRGLLEAEWLDRFLFQTLAPISTEQINATMARAVAAFLAA